jgi:hypothetical protein
MQVTTGSEDEESAPQGGVALLLCQRDLLSRDVREDDDADLASRSGTRLRSSRA